MMMPANFSVMAENELVYVVGGSAVTDWAKTFNTNLVTTIGNTYVQKLVNSTLGIMFGGAWGNDKSFSDGFKANYPSKMNGFNKFMQVVGTGAAIYQLGTVATTSFVEDVDGDDKAEKGNKWNSFLVTDNGEGGSIGWAPKDWISTIASWTK